VSVTPLELFFDLVFVYALTQVTGLMASTLSARGVLEGVIVLSLVWWCWVCFSWLGNSLKADEGWTRAVFFGVMAAMFVAALAIPEAYDDFAGGLSGPVVFAACYGVVRVAHVGLYAVAAASGGDRGLILQLARFTGVMTISVVLLVVGAALSGDAQLWLWLAAVVVDFGGTQAIGASGWRLPSPRHFSERHGLIIIVALGESIVAIGVGVSGLAISTGVILAAVLGIGMSAALWWVYFDITALGAERRLAQAPEADRPRLARDSYSFIHLPMVAGIVVAALGVKKVLSYVGGEDGHDWTDPLSGVALATLHSGPALFLLAMVAFRLRMAGSLAVSRLVAGLLLCATIPLGAEIGALTNLAVVVAILVGQIAFETTRSADVRHQVRHHAE
jgi:low temperature requirement protein LtrA